MPDFEYGKTGKNPPTSFANAWARNAKELLHSEIKAPPQAGSLYQGAGLSLAAFNGGLCGSNAHLAVFPEGNALLHILRAQLK